MGFVKDSVTKESLAGVSISDSKGKFLSQTNENGYFSISGANDTINLYHFGYKPLKLKLGNHSQSNIILLSYVSNRLEEVIIKPDIQGDLENNTTRFSVAEIKKLPSLLGEKDLIKMVQTLPGVKRIVEGGSGFSVRGGGTDQNLVMLENTPLYNYNHLFGLFSMFNTDAVKDVEFIKNGISAKYGGRASSVLNVRLKDGNLQNWAGDGAIGLLSTKISINGPLIKNKVSIMASGRRSYLDLVARPFQDPNNMQSYAMQDYGVKIAANLKNQKITSGIYYSKDAYSQFIKDVISPTLSFESPFKFNWQNRLIYSQYVKATYKNYISLQFYQSSYHFNYFEKFVINKQNVLDKLSQLDYNSILNDNGFNWNVENTSLIGVNLKYGVGFSLRSFEPRSLRRLYNVKGEISVENKGSIPVNSNIENYLYGELKKEFKQSSLSVGMRNVNWYRKGKVKSFLEPRMSFLNQFNKDQYFKLGYFKINQFVHLLSNTGGSIPTDLWITASEKIKPVAASQWSAGYSSLIYENIKLDVDVYFKNIKNIAQYRLGYNMLNITEGVDEDVIGLDTEWSDALVYGNGRSFGLEILLRKTIGKVNGQFSYTLSKTKYFFSGVNNGQWFYPKFDRLHDLSLLASFSMTKKLSFSSSFVFGTGSPVTLPNLIYFPDNIIIDESVTKHNLQTPYYNNYHNFRSHVFHRLDLGITHKKQLKHLERSWELSIFNAYANKNPFYYSITQYNPGEQMVAFSNKKNAYLTIIPSISYIISIK